jgi:hypothetical protein
LHEVERIAQSNYKYLKSVAFAELFFDGPAKHDREDEGDFVRLGGCLKNPAKQRNGGAQEVIPEPAVSCFRSTA